MAGSRPLDRGNYTSLSEDTNAKPTHKCVEYEHPGPKRAFWHRLGIAHLHILFLGSLVLLLASVALGLLWQESMIATSGAEARSPWIRVLSENWATGYVTVCTALIRTSIAFQANLATAMLAGIILERMGVPHFQGPFYSILRVLEVAPNKLLSATIFKSKGPLEWLVYTLVMIEVLITIASQFLSTILVSDFAGGNFANITNTTIVPTWNIPETGTGEKWWTVPPAASLDVCGALRASRRRIDLSRYGPYISSFLPFGNEVQRTNLRGFRGPAPVMDQRVVCRRPYLTSLHSGSASGVHVATPWGGVGLDRGPYHDVEMPQGEIYAEFNCELPIASLRMNTTRTGQSTLCMPKRRFANLSSDDPLVTNGPFLDANFLVIDVLSSEENWYHPDIGRQDLRVDHNDGLWAIVTNRSATELVGITACSTSFEAPTYGVEIRGSRERIERRIVWDSHENSHNTKAVRHQLGVSLASEIPEERGILRLGPRSQWQQGDYPNGQHPLAHFFYDSMSSAMSQLSGPYR